MDSALSLSLALAPHATFPFEPLAWHGSVTTTAAWYASKQCSRESFKAFPIPNLAGSIDKMHAALCMSHCWVPLCFRCTRLPELQQRTGFDVLAMVSAYGNLVLVPRHSLAVEALSGWKWGGTVHNATLFCRGTNSTTITKIFI